MRRIALATLILAALLAPCKPRVEGPPVPRMEPQMEPQMEPPTLPRCGRWRQMYCQFEFVWGEA